jgi:hypothetical protein
MNEQERQEHIARGYIPESTIEDPDFPNEVGLPGVCAYDIFFKECHKVRRFYLKSGSGPKAFGGACLWPGVDARVEFEVGEEELARDFAQRLCDFIEKFFEEVPE